ncbi:MAG TPA: hypothetical protein VKS03_01885 [Thermoanaerobaculia bacterium]|nr:hypothetical protein [Thermoanaerobaculia bacterium]
MKNAITLERDRWDGLAGAGTLRLSPRLVWGALLGELLAAIALFASGNVSPVLVRSLQLFLRF